MSSEEEDIDEGKPRIRISPIHEIQDGGSCFILLTEREVERRKDNTSPTKKVQTYHRTISDCCRSALLRHPEICKKSGVEDLMLFIDETAKEMVEAVKSYDPYKNKPPKEL